VGISQVEFAARLRTTITTVSRWENGRSEPNREALKKLAKMASDAGLQALRDFFEAQGRAAIAARIAKLPSAGTGRHVAVADLERWSEEQRALAFLIRGLAKVLSELPTATLANVLVDIDASPDILLRGLAGMARRLDTIGGDMQIYLRGAIPPKRSVSSELQSLLRELAEIENHEKEKK
jgi:transcriptional regulator with XRE-family HTH domain